MILVLWISSFGPLTELARSPQWWRLCSILLLRGRQNYLPLLLPNFSRRSWWFEKGRIQVSSVGKLREFYKFYIGYAWLTCNVCNPTFLTVLHKNLLIRIQLEAIATTFIYSKYIIYSIIFRLILFFVPSSSEIIYIRFLNIFNRGKSYCLSLCLDYLIFNFRWTIWLYSSMRNEIKTQKQNTTENRQIKHTSF